MYGSASLLLVPLVLATSSTMMRGAVALHAASPLNVRDGGYTCATCADRIDPRQHRDVSIVRRLSTIVCKSASTLSTLVTRASKVLRIQNRTPTLGLCRLKQIHIKVLRPLHTKVNLIINFRAVRMPFFRLPTLLTLTSIQGLFDVVYHHIYTFQAPRTRNGQLGKTRKSPPRSPSPSSSLAAKSIPATIVIQGRAYPWRVIESRH